MTYGGIWDSMVSYGKGWDPMGVSDGWANWNLWCPVGCHGDGMECCGEMGSHELLRGPVGSLQDGADGMGGEVWDFMVSYGVLWSPRFGEMVYYGLLLGPGGAGVVSYGVLYLECSSICLLSCCCCGSSSPELFSLSIIPSSSAGSFFPRRTRGPENSPCSCPNLESPRLGPLCLAPRWPMCQRYPI